MSSRHSAAERLWTGGDKALRHWRQGCLAWISAGKTGGDTALRVVFLVVGIALAWLLIRGMPLLLWGIVPWWLWHAWKAGATPPAEAPEDPTKTADSQPSEEPQSDPHDAYYAVLEWVDKGIANKNGVHLADLLANAHANNLLTSLDLPAFRAALEGWGIPVRQQLKVGGRNRPGIHREDLPPSPSPAAAPRVATEAATTPITSTDTVVTTYAYLDGRPTTGGDHDH